ncbi:hypothetical protein ACLHDG_06815 [Sulfurovum sp. CS9]|uniref:hypothetical protein n=1 Tax=Sulfurovum sp. CS9 TaxID=3391146 RepID=UPI0039EBC6D5
MKRGNLFLVVLTVLLITTYSNASAANSPLQVGWAIGHDVTSGTAVILHTKNGGKKWVVQGDNAKWKGCNGNDISAVDKHTAWAALGSSTPDGSGKILHTTNGGVTWIEQTLPEGVQGGIKNIKGLTHLEAWAASLEGTVLHTTDGGEVWSIVEHPDFEIGRVNRMDAIGYRDVRDTDRSGKNTGKIHANVWIADEEGDDNGHLGMIHTLYNGDIWRQEYLPPTNNTYFMVHMVSAYSARVVWAATWGSGALFRTLDGGENWKIETEVGPNDIDDMCAYGADALWFVQFQASASGAGHIYHLRLEDGEVEIDDFTPDLNYKYEGLTCVNDQVAVVVGNTSSNDPTLQRGIISATNDGGQTWENQPLPVDDVYIWKVSFVGARR